MRKSIAALTLILVLAQGCCVSKTELAADVAAWRSFTDAVEPDLRRAYLRYPEPTRSTRLGLLADNRDAVAAAESRARGVK